MSAPDVTAIVHGAIARTFNFPPAAIMDTTCAFDVPGWDSVSNAYLILEIEDHIGIELPIDLVLQAANVGQMVALIEDCTCAPSRRD